MRAIDALRHAQDLLEQARVDDALLEAELLLCHVLGIDRAGLLASLCRSLTPSHSSTFSAFVERRRHHEPTAYIVGRKEFYDLELEVTPHALIPRPETELLVEEALRKARNHPSPRIVDVGTGGGAIALALSKHLPEALVVGTDISGDALSLARRNAHRVGLGRNVHWVQTDLLAGLGGPFDLLVANLPYVNNNDWETLPPEIRLYEPRQALDGGPDGLGQIRRLFAEAPQHLASRGALIVEIGWDQGLAVMQLSQRMLPTGRAELKRDLAGRDRVFVFDNRP